MIGSSMVRITALAFPARAGRAPRRAPRCRNGRGIRAAALRRRDRHRCRRRRRPAVCDQHFGDELADAAEADDDRARRVGHLGLRRHGMRRLDLARQPPPGKRQQRRHHHPDGGDALPELLGGGRDQLRRGGGGEHDQRRLRRARHQDAGLGGGTGARPHHPQQQPGHQRLQHQHRSVAARSEPRWRQTMARSMLMPMVIRNTPSARPLNGSMIDSTSP